MKSRKKTKKVEKKIKPAKYTENLIPQKRRRKSSELLKIKDGYPALIYNFIEIHPESITAISVCPPLVGVARNNSQIQLFLLDSWTSILTIPSIKSKIIKIFSILDLYIRTIFLFTHKLRDSQLLEENSSLISNELKDLILISTGLTGDIIIWDLKLLRPKLIINERNCGIWDASLRIDCKRLCTADNDSRISIFALKFNHTKSTIDHNHINTLDYNSTQLKLKKILSLQQG